MHCIIEGINVLLMKIIIRYLLINWCGLYLIYFSLKQKQICRYYDIVWNMNGTTRKLVERWAFLFSISYTYNSYMYILNIHEMYVGLCKQGLLCYNYDEKTKLSSSRLLCFSMILIILGVSWLISLFSSSLILLTAYENVI